MLANHSLVPYWRLTPIQPRDTVINKFQHGHSRENFYFSNMQCWLTVHLYPYWRLTPIQPRDTVINKLQHGHSRENFYFSNMQCWLTVHSCPYALARPFFEAITDR